MTLQIITRADVALTQLGSHMSMHFSVASAVTVQKMSHKKMKKTEKKENKSPCTLLVVIFSYFSPTTDSLFGYDSSSLQSQEYVCLASDSAVFFFFSFFPTLKEDEKEKGNKEKEEEEEQLVLESVLQYKKHTLVVTQLVSTFTDG